MSKKSKILAPHALTQNAEFAIRSSAAEYLTFVAAIGDNPTSVEMRYQDENIWLTQKMMALLAEIAKMHAETKFEKYRIVQDSLFQSDFDKYMLKLAKQIETPEDNEIS